MDRTEIFYEEQMIKVQEEFKGVTDKETKRRIDLLSMLERLERQLSRYRRENLIKIKEKLYIDWAKQFDGYEISTFSHLGLLRFECGKIDEIYARLNTIFHLSNYDIYFDCNGYGLGIKDILNEKGLEVNKLNFKMIK